MAFLNACASVTGLGFLYFISAIPAGAALGLPIAVAAFCAWFGYTLGALVIALLGAPARKWLESKLKIHASPDKPTLLLRAWKKYGLPALGLLAPVTVGPQVGMLFGLVLGESVPRMVIALSLGALPTTLLFAALTAWGFKLAA